MMTDNELNTLTNRELSVIVGEKLMGWEPGTLDEYRKQVAEWGEGKTAFDWVGLVTYLPDYANDIAAAWQVVETLRGLGLTISIATPPPGWQNWDVRGWNTTTNDNRFIAHAATAPRAICLAALKAVGVEVE